MAYKAAMEALVIFAARHWLLAMAVLVEETLAVVGALAVLLWGQVAALEVRQLLALEAAPVAALVLAAIREMVAVEPETPLAPTLAWLLPQEVVVLVVAAAAALLAVTTAAVVVVALASLVRVPMARQAVLAHLLVVVAAAVLPEVVARAVQL